MLPISEALALEQYKNLLLSFFCFPASLTCLLLMIKLYISMVHSD